MKAAVSDRLWAYSNVFLRLTLGIKFLSVVADRFGLLGPPGTRNVAWGSFEVFLDNVRTLNPFLMEALVPAVGWGVTLAELAAGVLLLLGLWTRVGALLGGVLLLTFTFSTGIAFGAMVPLNYSIVIAAAASFFLAAQTDFPLSIDRIRHPEQVRTEPVAV